MSESRLFQIIYHLLDKGEVTASELADKFEVSIRTIYRDIDKLSSAGIPVYTTTGYKGGIHLDENFVLKKSLLSKEDMQNILMGIQSLSAVGYSQQEDCLTKLKGLFQMQDAGWMEVDYSRWGCDEMQERKIFGLLKEAIQQKYQVHFAYYSSQGETSHRECLPIKLIFKDRSWYLRAYCLKRNAERLFRLSRIRELSVTDRNLSASEAGQFLALSENMPQESALLKTIASEEGLSETSLSENTSSTVGQIIEMKLSFDKIVAYRIFDFFDESVITITEDSLIVKTAMPEDEWLYGFLMSFGDRLTILSPVRLKDALIERYRSALKHFEAAGSQTADHFGN